MKKATVFVSIMTIVVLFILHGLFVGNEQQEVRAQTGLEWMESFYKKSPFDEIEDQLSDIEEQNDDLSKQLSDIETILYAIEEQNEYLSSQLSNIEIQIYSLE